MNVEEHKGFDDPLKGEKLSKGGIPDQDFFDPDLFLLPYVPEDGVSILIHPCRVLVKVLI